MNSAVIGFLGVIAGAILAGGIQWLGAWFDRLRARQTAARLIWGDLVLAAGDLKAFVHYRGWSDEGWDLPSYLEAWRRYAEPFSTVGTAQFHTVAGAFTRLETLTKIRDAYSSEEDKGWSEAALRITDDIAVCEEAANAALRAGFTWRERRRGDEAWETYWFGEGDGNAEEDDGATDA